MKGCDLRYFIYTNNLTFLRWTGKDMTTPCFEIFNYIISPILFGYTSLTILWRSSYLSCISSGTVLLRWWKYFTKNVSSIKKFRNNAINYRIQVCSTDTTNFDLHNDPKIISLTKVSLGGTNTTQVSSLFHSVSYQCSTSPFLFNIIYLVWSKLLWLSV